MFLPTEEFSRERAEVREGDRPDALRHEVPAVHGSKAVARRIDGAAERDASRSRRREIYEVRRIEETAAVSAVIICAALAVLSS